TVRPGAGDRAGAVSHASEVREAPVIRPVRARQSCPATDALILDDLAAHLEPPPELREDHELVVCTALGVARPPRALLRLLEHLPENARKLLDVLGIPDEPAVLAVHDLRAGSYGRRTRQHRYALPHRLGDSQRSEE